LPASISIGIINLAATFSSCLSRVSHPVCRATGLGGGVGLLERIQLHRVGCQSGNDGVTIQRYFEAARVPYLWNEA
jgi:hypothetical protein